MARKEITVMSLCKETTDPGLCLTTGKKNKVLFVSLISANKLKYQIRAIAL